MNEKLRRFMMGRYGNDYLNRFLVITAMLLMLVSIFFAGKILKPLAWILVILSFVRMFSRNIYQRQHENMIYWQFRSRFLSWFGLQKKRWQERKTHRYFNCPVCRSTMRVPKGKGKILITCRKCGHEFERKS